MSKYWKIAVEAPMREALTYLAPEDGTELARGQCVRVPLGKRQVRGLVLAPGEDLPDVAMKAVGSIDLSYPPLPSYFTDWLEWVAKYYIYPIGLVAATAYPPLNKTEKQRKSQRAPVIPTLAAVRVPELTSSQTKVIADIQTHPEFRTHLLFGVTGSGKTEVYLQLLTEVLKKQRRGLVLVPEISLTPQLIHRFAERFGDQIAVLHSQLTERERTNQWWDIVSGNKKILIGARSALFCPIDNLGLIIVDEEHEPSFKQDEKLKYHGRDAAIMLARGANCPIVLGSATPSLESWNNALEGKYSLHKMENRVENRALPELRILDLKSTKNKAHAVSQIPGWLHPQLFEEIAMSLGEKTQVALFLNRRGTANVVVCPACGFTHECPNCDITLTLHAKVHLVCHYCDYHEPTKQICPDCKEGEMTPLGVGTEQVEADIRTLFPKARVARADRDEIQSRQDLEDLIFQMENNEIDILVGTQMIAKGLDFPNLKLVGLVLADVGFNLPDFRSTERSFQLITQVSGRAGRHIKPGDRPGQVFIQTLNPDHLCLQYALRHDYEGFASQEIESRRQLNYPPLGKLASFRIQGLQLDRVQRTARLLAQRAEHLKMRSPNYSSIEVLGPAEAPIAKLRGHHRHHLLLKGHTSQSLNSFCHQLLGDETWVLPGIRVIVDVDPLHLL